MTISPRQWSRAAADKLIYMAVKASLQDEFMFGKSNITVLTGFAMTLREETGQNFTYEDVLLKFNDLYMHHIHWQWVIQQPGLTRDPKTSMLSGSDEVWRRTVWEKPFAALYKFTAERYEILMMKIFNYPLRVANKEDVEHSLHDLNKFHENQDVISYPTPNPTQWRLKEWQGITTTELLIIFTEMRTPTQSLL